MRFQRLALGINLFSFSTEAARGSISNLDFPLLADGHEGYIELLCGYSRVEFFFFFGMASFEKYIADYKNVSRRFL